MTGTVKHALDRRGRGYLKGAALRASRYREYLSLHEDDERMWKLAAIWERLSTDEQRECLAYCWQHVEVLYPFEKLALGLFQRAGYVTDAPDERLSYPLAVYRGSSDGSVGLSWTLELARARWFARRFAFDQKVGGVVLAAEVGASAVLAYFTSRNESEVVLDPTALREVHILEGRPDPHVTWTFDDEGNARLAPKVSPGDD